MTETTQKRLETGASINWSGNIGFLGAVTPVYDKHYSVIGAMGDRFLLYRSKTKDDFKQGLRAIKTVGNEKEMRTEIKDAFHKFINQFDMTEINFEPTKEGR